MKLYAVGIGPGDTDYIAPKGKMVLQESDVIVGYSTYIDLISELTTGKKIIQNGMKNEVERCRLAVEEARQGKKVAVVSSGDAGIYGMASLLYEVAEQFSDIEIEVIPGITAAVAAAAVLGSPLTNDFAVISLSDLLTPWDVIEKRLIAVSQCDMAICLYNPQSHKRSDYLRKACDIALQYKPPQTNCGYVRNAFRVDSTHGICSLEQLRNTDVDMFTTVIIGNSSTRIIGGRLVTTRGYSV